jgi:PAS domain S-box-containing protein
MEERRSITSDSSKIFLDTIIQNVPHRIFWKDINLVYLGCNQAFADSVGLNSPKDVVGKVDFDLPAKREESIAYMQDDRDVMNSRKSKLNIEEPLTLPDGKKITILTSKIPLINENNEVFGVLGIFTDITDYKENIAIAENAKAKAEAEEKLRHVITTYAGAVAHNMASPLMAIRCSTELMNRLVNKLIAVYEEAKSLNLKSAEAIDKRQLALLDESESPLQDILNSVNTLNNYISNNLESLYLAVKVHEGRAELDDLMICDMKDNLKRLHINILHIKNDHSFEYLGNSISVDQILTNLLKNALEQIELNGKGEIYITTENDGDKNILRFKDTGGGAPAEVVDHMFDGNFTTKEQGHGVGLPFCRNTMKLFGGDLIAQSVHGDYMEFSLIFPKIDEKKSVTEPRIYITAQLTEIPTNNKNDIYIFVNGNPARLFHLDTNGTIEDLYFDDKLFKQNLLLLGDLELVENVSLQQQDISEDIIKKFKDLIPGYK